jgi:hypothetical protein
MPRKLRVEYPGAIYHVLNLGDRREDIFKDDLDRAGFRCPATGKGKSPVFHRKTRGLKTGASSSAATANAVTAEFTPSIDRKKGRFLGLFCRKTGVRRQLFNTLLCVFTRFWDSWLFQTLAPQGEPARGRLKNKSCLKTYRRFFVRSGMCLN